MARPQVNYGQFDGDALTPNQRRIVDPGLRPTASAVESFVRPVNTLDPTAGQKAQQLAQALAGLAPSLSRMAITLQTRRNERNTQEGQMAAAEAARQGLSFKDAVEKGVIRRTDNPFFVRGAKEQFGRIAADRMHTDLAVNLEKELADVSEPGEILAALDDAQRTWMATNVGENADGSFQTGFSLRAAAHMETLRGQLLQRASKNLENRSDAAIFAEVRKHIVDTAGAMPLAAVAEDINQLREDLLAQGRDAQAVDKALLKAVGETMLERGGKDVSQLFDLVKGSSGLSLRDVFGEKSSEYVRSVINGHHALWRQETQEKLADENIRQKEVLDQAADDTISLLMQNPQAPLDDLIRKYASERGALTAISNAAKSVYEVNAVEDPEIAEDLLIEVMNNGLRKSEVLSRLARGEFKLATAAKAISWIKSRDAEERSIAAAERAESRQIHQIKEQTRRERAALIADPQLKAAISNLKAKFADESKPWLTKDAARRREYAQAQLIDAWLRWKDTDEGATAGLAETNKWLFDASVAIEQSQWNEAVGGPYSGKKNPVPTALTPLAKPDAAGQSRPALTQQQIQYVFTQKKATPEILEAARKAGRDISKPAEVMKFINEQAALYTQNK